jgi:hypothetical protein
MGPLQIEALILGVAVPIIIGPGGRPAGLKEVASGEPPLLFGLVVPAGWFLNCE